MTTVTQDQIFQPGVTRESVEALNRACGVEWFDSRRFDALAAYESIPMPSRRDERWRFTNLRGISLDSIPSFSRSLEEVDKQLARMDRGLLAGLDRAGVLSHVEGQSVDISADNLPDGVIFTTLETAAKEHAELLDRHFGSAVPLTDSVDDKFVAMQQATLGNGVFLFVPRNTAVDAPLVAQVLHARDNGHVNWRALIVLEEGASATFMEEFMSLAGDLNGFSNAVVELVVGQNATLHYTTVQDYARPVAHFATHRVIAAKDSTVEWTAVGLGASRGKSRMEARLTGSGASVRLNGAYVLDGKQELDYDTQQVHEAPNAFSDLAFKGVLSDTAHSVWRGIIDVRPGAQGTDSYQENRNLLLNSGAHADSIPGLQIEANEVRCTHGATISKVDEEQLFYLQARGISREEATKTIVRGFFAPLLARIHPEPVREGIREALWERLDRTSS